MHLDLPLIAPLSIDSLPLMEKRIRFLWTAGVRVATISALHPQAPYIFERLVLSFGQGLRFGLHDVCSPDMVGAYHPMPITLAVMPHTEPALIKTLAQRGIPTMAGVFTISEIRQAVGAGADMLHLYPIQGLSPSVMSTFLRFIPSSVRCFGTGTISEKELFPWIKEGLTGVIPEGLFDLEETPEGLQQKEAVSFISSLKLAFRTRNGQQQKPFVSLGG